MATQLKECYVPFSDRSYNFNTFNSGGVYPNPNMYNSMTNYHLNMSNYQSANPYNNMPYYSNTSSVHNVNNTSALLPMPLFNTPQASREMTSNEASVSHPYGNTLSQSSVYATQASQPYSDSTSDCANTSAAVANEEVTEVEGHELLPRQHTVNSVWKLLQRINSQIDLAVLMLQRVSGSSAGSQNDVCDTGGISGTDGHINPNLLTESSPNECRSQSSQISDASSSSSNPPSISDSEMKEMLLVELEKLRHEKGQLELLFASVHTDQRNQSQHIPTGGISLSNTPPSAAKLTENSHGATRNDAVAPEVHSNNQTQALSLEQIPSNSSVSSGYGTDSDKVSLTDTVNNGSVVHGVIDVKNVLGSGDDRDGLNPTNSTISVDDAIGNTSANSVLNDSINSVNSSSTSIPLGSNSNIHNSGELDESQFSISKLPPLNVPIEYQFNSNNKRILIASALEKGANGDASESTDNADERTVHIQEFDGSRHWPKGLCDGNSKAKKSRSSKMSADMLKISQDRYYAEAVYALKMKQQKALLEEQRLENEKLKSHEAECKGSDSISSSITDSERADKTVHEMDQMVFDQHMFMGSDQDHFVQGSDAYYYANEGDSEDGTEGGSILYSPDDVYDEMHQDSYGDVDLKKKSDSNSKARSKTKNKRTKSKTCAPENFNAESYSNNTSSNFHDRNEENYQEGARPILSNVRPSAREHGQTLNAGVGINECVTGKSTSPPTSMSSSAFLWSTTEPAHDAQRPSNMSNGGTTAGVNSASNHNSHTEAAHNTKDSMIDVDSHVARSSHGSLYASPIHPHSHNFTAINRNIHSNTHAHMGGNTNGMHGETHHISLYGAMSPSGLGLDLDEHSMDSLGAYTDMVFSPMKPLHPK